MKIGVDLPGSRKRRLLVKSLTPFLSVLTLLALVSIGRVTTSQRRYVT